jgi:hypothetical protein
MRTKNALICDYSPCKGLILTKGDHYMVGNCSFHVKCWKRLFRLSRWRLLQWDLDILYEIELLNQEGEGGGHA